MKLIATDSWELWVGCAWALCWCFNGGKAICIRKQDYKAGPFIQRCFCLWSQDWRFKYQGSYPQGYRFMYQQQFLDRDSWILPLHCCTGRQWIWEGIGLHCQIQGHCDLTTKTHCCRNYYSHIIIFIVFTTYELWKNHFFYYWFFFFQNQVEHFQPGLSTVYFLFHAKSEKIDKRNALMFVVCLSALGGFWEAGNWIFSYNLVFEHCKSRFLWEFVSFHICYYSLSRWANAFSPYKIIMPINY